MSPKVITKKAHSPKKTEKDQRRKSDPKTSKKGKTDLEEDENSQKESKKDSKKAKTDTKENTEPKKGAKKAKMAKTPPYAAFKNAPKSKKAENETEKLKISDLKPKPKTLKDLKKNAEILKAHNDNHEDDLFKNKKATKSTSKAKPKPQRASDILNDLFNDSDSEQNISLHSAKTPILAFIDRSRSANQDEDSDDDYGTG